MSRLLLELKIKKAYFEAIPRPPKERYEEIKEDIKVKGQQVPIYINKDYEILDGYTRYQICKELNINPITETKTFENKLEEERFVYVLNVKRRDLADYTHIILQLKIDEIDVKLAGDKMKNPYATLHKGHLDINKKIADKTGRGQRTVSKVRQIEKIAPKEIKQALHEKKKTINEVYQKIKKEEKKKELQAKLRQTQINLPKTVQLHNKDFRKLTLPKNKISLIFTDPPYAEEYLYLYEELGKQAFQVLRDGGSLVCFAGHYAIGRIINMVEKHGLKFHWPLVVLHSGLSTSVFWL